MTAAELVVLLHAHPKTCERLGITIGRRMGIRWAMTDEGDLGAFEDSDQLLASRLRLWVRGAASEWCDEHGIDIKRFDDDDWRNGLRKDYKDLSIPIAYESRLHACLAAIEAST